MKIKERYFLAKIDNFEFLFRPIHFNCVLSLFTNNRIVRMNTLKKIFMKSNFMFLLFLSPRALRLVKVKKQFLPSLEQTPCYLPVIPNQRERLQQNS